MKSKEEIKKKLFIDGDLKLYSIDSDLQSSFLNGLMSKHIHRDYTYRVYKEQPIWFQEKGLENIRASLVDVAASRQIGYVVLCKRTSLDPESRRPLHKIVQRVARVTKLHFSCEMVHS